MGEIRVLIVDDSAFMRHALGRLLTEEPDIEVVGAASNGDEGLRMAAELRPDVITLDVEMPVLDGVGMLRRLMLETPTRVVMLSSRKGEIALQMPVTSRYMKRASRRPTGPPRLLARGGAAR